MSIYMLSVRYRIARTFLKLHLKVHEISGETVPAVFRNICRSQGVGMENMAAKAELRVSQ